ncbi:FtsW/RodA/SpoVE family cell cycle protein [Corynebacterium uterequi]|uniref:Probable peptidoglycan glycosyltransferase FtsW n=1 Tax=Corynebacterium uterequi TaxID=1072256 RepID=A0A0G3HDS1_9CORY|nr:putative peptidoglycan glycosyltransferase FtsW [Corynebacterium uterequi]AKK11459.1 bacterial cell division membrane protein [Corynebacterium uterequi]
MSSPTAERRAWTLESLGNKPVLDYYLIMALVIFLSGLGVVMVFSASMTWSIAEGAGVFSTALRQSIMVGLGVVALWIALKMPMRTVRKLAPVLMLVTIALLVAVLIPGIGTGRESVGSQSWISLGVVQIQPSELAKVAIAVWGAAFLADKPTTARSLTQNYYVGYSVVAALCFGLIAGQGDLGMALSFGLVVAITLIFAGISFRFIAYAAVAVAVGLVVVFFSGTYRSARFTTYFDALTGHFSDTRGADYQAYQGFLSLAEGSFTGVGIGQSRAKWFYLPEAKNDFIFAIIGEEMGLLGAALVICAFGALGVMGMRTARRAQNQFQALLAISLTFGVVSQAFVNIGYVVGLLPVTGIQLPMISAGGTSAVITIGSMGLLASVARHEPEAVSAMQNYGRPILDVVFGIGEPQLENAPRRVDVRRRRTNHTTPVTSRKQPRNGTASMYTPRRTPPRGRYDDPRRR